MTYGVAAKKKACVYVSDGGDTYLVKHTQDVIDAGGFTTGVSGSPKPGKKFHMRHVGLYDSAGPHRTTLKIGTKAQFDGLALGDSITYGGISWEITSKEGEKSVA